MDIYITAQREWMGLNGQFGGGSTYGDTELYSTRVSSAHRSRSTKMGDGEHATIPDISELWKDCKDLIAMIKEPQVWPSFAIELERIETLQICFPEFKIIHVP